MAINAAKKKNETAAKIFAKSRTKTTTRQHDGFYVTIMRAVTFCLLITIEFALINAQITNGQTAVSRPFNERVQVTPQCRSDMIIVHVRFNPDFRSRFTDWIMVGENSRTECRLRGNGELRYVVQIVFRNDPCQTKQIEPNVFQNTLRIAQFPGIILQDDLNFSFKCTSGVPEVVEFRLPQVNPTFDINRNVLSGSSRDLLPLQTLANTPPTPRNNLLNNNNNDLFEDGSVLGRPDFRNANLEINDQNVNLNRFAAGNLPTTNAGLNTNNFNNNSRQFDNSSMNNMVAILLSILLILMLLLFLLCLFLCLRRCQRRNVDKNAGGGALMKGRVGEITAPMGRNGQTQTQRLLSARGASRGQGAGQNSSATNSPLSQIDSNSHSPDSSSFGNAEGRRRPADEEGPWWVGKGGAQSYLLASNEPSPPPSHQRQQKHIVRAVDVPQQQQIHQAQLQQQAKKQQQQQKEVDDEKLAASAAFRDALHFAHAHSTELIRAPNSYAEWRERTLKRGRGSNGADLLLESEADSSSSQNNISDESNEAAHKERMRGSASRPALRSSDRELFDNALSPLPPAIHTPLRSITEVYHAVETRQHANGAEDGRATRHFQKNSAQQRVNKSTPMASGVFVEEQNDDITLHSSDEGEYSIPRSNANIKMQAPQKAAPSIPSAEMREKFVHCADSIRGFGPRKLTEQEISRWRQLIRGDPQLQSLILEAASLEELKALCEMPEYRLHFTRTKWSQIMECVANVTLKNNVVSQTKTAPAHAETSRKPPPPSYEVATLSRRKGLQEIPANAQQQASSAIAQQQLPTSSKNGAFSKEKTPVSQLNLRLNLFKSFGLPTSSSSTTIATSGNANSRIHPTESEQPIASSSQKTDHNRNPSALHVYIGGGEGGGGNERASQADETRARW